MNNKFPTKADWVGMIIGFLPAAIIVTLKLPVGGLWVFLIALGGFYGVKKIAEKIINS
jgi:hypothetical protein